jgi:hypothetical protein
MEELEAFMKALPPEPAMTAFEVSQRFEEWKRNRSAKGEPSFIGTRPGVSPVAIKLPIFFRRWAAKLGFIKAYQAPHPISCLHGHEGNIFAACENMVFKLDNDGVMRPLRFEWTDQTPNDDGISDG